MNREGRPPVPKGRHGPNPDPPPGPPTERRFGVSKSATIVFAAISFLWLSLGAVSHVLAAPPQSWTFTAKGLATGPFTIPNIVVTSTDNKLGSFDVNRTFPPAGDCQQGFSVRISGTMTSVVALTASSPDRCTGILAPVAFTATLILVPFPNATSFTGAVPGFPGVSLGGTCDSGCLGPIEQATAGVRQAAALGTLALTTTNVQTTNIGLRLAALRRGARGVSLSGLSLNADGQPVPLGALTNIVERGGGASADGSSMLSRLGLFANGQGSFGNQDATSREPGFDFHTGGLTLGGDYRFTDQFLLGIALGYLRTKATFDAGGGDSRINGYSISAYGNYYLWDKLYVDGIFTFGWNTYDTDRNITGADLTAQGSTDGTQVAISVSSGYNLDVGAFSFGPTARVNYVRVHIDGFRERAAGPFNLDVESQTVESLTTALGGQATYAISLPWGVLTPHVRFEWEHEYKGNSRTVTANLLADPATIVAAQTNGPDRDYVNLGAGLSGTFKGGVSAFVAYTTVRGRDHFTNHSFNAGIRFEF